TSKTWSFVPQRRMKNAAAGSLVWVLPIHRKFLQARCSAVSKRHSEGWLFGNGFGFGVEGRNPLAQGTLPKAEAKSRVQLLSDDPRHEPSQYGIPIPIWTVGVYRKFSTSIRSLPAWSNCEKSIDRPSGEPDNPSEGPPDIVATVVALPVANLRNWMEDF